MTLCIGNIAFEIPCDENMEERTQRAILEVPEKERPIVEQLYQSGYYVEVTIRVTGDGRKVFDELKMTGNYSAGVGIDIHYDLPDFTRR